MKKNVKLLGILIVLIIISATIALVDTDKKKQNFDQDIFKVGTIESIVSIGIEGNGSNNLIENKGGNWLLNEGYDTDPDLVKILSTIMSQVIVKRPVARLSNDDIFKTLESSGKKVIIRLNDGSERGFLTGGNATKTVSYFGDLSDRRAYVVEIPGYKNYIAGIFELTENQWRDRLLFSSSWRTIKELSIDYNNGQNLKITFEDRFLKVKGVDQMDTTVLLAYLAQYEYFQVNDYLNKGEFPRYDSLLATLPLAKITIRDIDAVKNNNLNVFSKIASERFYLLTDDSNQMMVVDQKRMEGLLFSNQQFKSQ